MERCEILHYATVLENTNLHTSVLSLFADDTQFLVLQIMTCVMF